MIQLPVAVISQGKGIVTVSMNEVPVIHMNMGDAQIYAVNFLRSGCPVVQVICTVSDGLPAPEPGSSLYGYQEIANAIAAKVEGEIGQLEQPGEVFEVTAPRLFRHKKGEQPEWVFEYRRVVTTPDLAPTEHSRPAINTLED